MAIVTNRYAKKVSDKEQPVKDINGFVSGTIDAIQVKEASESAFDIPTIEIHVNLVGEKGGIVKQKLFFDLVFGVGKNGLTKLPATLKKLGVMTSDEIESFINLDEFECEALDPYLEKLFDLKIRFKSVQNSKGKFQVDFKSLALADAPTGIRTIQRKTKPE